MRNTGHHKWLIIEIVLMFFMPYPFLNNYTYYEVYNSVRYDYKINSLLLVVMTFVRLHQLVRCSLIVSYWTSPRSQRVCAMNGVTASNMFAIKSLMKAKPYTVLGISMVISVA